MKWIAAFLILSGCATAPRDATLALEGSWGGPHIGLTVGQIDTFVEFDCAEGVIHPPHPVNADGTFTWDGTYTRGTGGPVRLGEKPTPVHATYSGVIAGPRMMLVAKLDDGQAVGPFTLERAKPPQIYRCL